MLRTFPIYETLKALADNRLRITEAAKALWVSRNCMTHRVQRIIDITGLDPTDFWDMQKLLQMYKDEEGK